MDLHVQSYNLTDEYLFRSTQDGYMIWQPEEVCIVLGISNNAEESLFTEKVISDSVPVFKRPTGGQAVVLTPMNMVITVAKTFPGKIGFREFFRMVNGIIVDSLSEKGIPNLSMKGISDVSISNKKILGSSMRSEGNRLVYHAVLNLAQDPLLFERYLRHPRREPDYRAGRKHREFVTSIKKEGYDIDNKEMAGIIGKKIETALNLKSL